MDYKKQAEDLLYSVYSLRKRIISYRYLLDKYQNCSGSDNETEKERIKENLRKAQSRIDDISFVVGQLTSDDQMILRLWYFEKLTKKEIAAHLYISSPKTIYCRKDKALKNFIDIYPW